MVLVDLTHEIIALAIATEKDIFSCVYDDKFFTST